jgi:hypothetical protein
VRALTLIQSKRALQRPLRHAHRVTGLEPWTTGQLDRSIALARTDLVDDTIAQLGWFAAGHDYCSHANAPTRIPPSPVLKANEAIARKQRPKPLNTASAFGLSFADIRDIDRELGELEKAPRRQFTRRLGSRNYPTHRSPRPERVAGAGNGSHVLGTDRGTLDKLGRPMVPRARTHAKIGRWVEKGAPYVPQGAIANPFTSARDRSQSALGGMSKGAAIGRREPTG